MYNQKLTSGTFDGNLTVARGHKLITDADGKALGTLSKKHICDLNGKEIATYVSTEKSVSAEGKTVKKRIYDSSLGKLKLSDNVVWLGEEALGTVPSRERNLVAIIMLAIASLLLISTILFVAVVDVPFLDKPTIDIKDKNGALTGNGTIAVLGDSIAPGSSGAYEFIINNPHNVPVIYEFKISDYYEDEEITGFPMEFRLKMNNMLVGEGKWLSADELVYSGITMLPESSHTFTLEWRWLFEGGNDEYDTTLGRENGEYSLKLHLTAETYEEG